MRPASGVGAAGQRLILKEYGVIITAGDAVTTGQRQDEDGWEATFFPLL